MWCAPFIMARTRGWPAGGTNLALGLTSTAIGRRAIFTSAISSGLKPALIRPVGALNLAARWLDNCLAAGYDSLAELHTSKRQKSDKAALVIYKIFAGTALALAVFIVVALRVNTTGSYERTFNASSDKLWRIWNDPDFIKKWWGPHDFTAQIIRNDARVGGSFLWSMKSAKGEMYWNTGIYKQVAPNLRMVSTLSFSDETGRAIPGSQAPVPGHWPDEIIVITEFTVSGGRTKVTITEVGIPLIAKILSKIAWNQQFDKIESLLNEENSDAH